MEENRKFRKSQSVNTKDIFQLNLHKFYEQSVTVQSEVVKSSHIRKVHEML